jgi:hypothetical protein
MFPSDFTANVLYPYLIPHPLRATCLAYLIIPLIVTNKNKKYWIPHYVVYVSVGSSEPISCKNVCLSFVSIRELIFMTILELLDFDNTYQFWLQL